MRRYEADFAGWAEDTARAICDGRWDEIDRAALADEVASLSRQERHALLSHLTVLLQHLLKLRYQPLKASRSWELTVVSQREDSLDRLAESPSLRPVLGELTTKAYQRARRRAAKEIGLPLDTFPPENPFSYVEIWGDDDVTN